MKTLVLLPALLCNEGLFSPQIAALKDRANIVVPDLSRDTDLAAAARRILSEIPAEKFCLCGISMGVYVAFEILRQASARVEALCLTDTNPFGETEQSSKNRAVMIARAQANGLESIVESSQFSVLAPENRDKPMIKELLPKMVFQTGLRGYVNEQKTIMSRPDSRDLLNKISCPTLVAGGALDALSTPAIMDDMARQIPNATRIVIPNSGHFPPLENPDAMTAALELLLSQSK